MPPPILRSTRFVLTCLALVLAARAGAQAPATVPPVPDAAFSESIDVDVVDVEVFVTDRAGRPVEGLGRGDFELRVDGRPVAITNFYASAGASPGVPPAAPAGPSGPPAAPAAPPAAAAVPEAQRLTLVVFLDGPGLSPQSRNQALRDLTGFFRTALQPTDRVLLASYDGYAIKLRLPPAGDVAAVVAALHDVATVTSRGGISSAEEATALADLKRAEHPVEAEWARLRLEFVDLERHGETRTLLRRVLLDFVGSLARLPGRKALLFLTGDLRVDAGEPLARELADRANAERVTLYGLGAPWHEVESYADRTRWSPSVRHDDLSQLLYQVTAPTGGLSSLDLDHPAALLDRIRGDLASFYSLGFAPAHPGDGRRHRVAVRVRGRKGLDVRFPASYVSRPRGEPAPPGGR